MKPFFSLIKVISLCLMVFILTGCANLAPKYSVPETPVPTSWPTGPAYQQQTAAQAGQAVVWGQSGLGPHAKDERHYIPSIKPYYRSLLELGKLAR